MKRSNTLKAIIIIYVIISAAAIVFFVADRLNDLYDQPDLTEEYADEISRIKYFISDWYNELSSAGNKVNVYLNELQFSGAKFSLTYFNGSVRAVYPRGERFFKAQYINNIEYFEVDGKLRCRLYYGEDGVYMFKLN